MMQRLTNALPVIRKSLGLSQGKLSEMTGLGQSTISVPERGNDHQHPRSKPAMAIRKLPNAYAAGIPIIAMTANAFEEDTQNALAAGMNGHIAKPVDVDKLIKTLSEILK